jgi:hypothetical protein
MDLVSINSSPSNEAASRIDKILSGKAQSSRSKNDHPFRPEDVPMKRLEELGPGNELNGAKRLNDLNHLNESRAEQ